MYWLRRKRIANNCKSCYDAVMVKQATTTKRTTIKATNKKSAKKPVKKTTHKKTVAKEDFHPNWISFLVPVAAVMILFSLALIVTM